MMNSIFYTSMLTALLTLLSPLMANMAQLYTNAVKRAFMISLIPMTIFLWQDLESITTHFYWINTDLNIKISFIFDKFSMLFIPTALFITWAILQFTHWYMANDQNKTVFSQYLTLFLIAMITLTTANNMLQLFVGWEGVGIMSFLLIGWWHSRTNAMTSALQAVIYNRIGDIGLVLSMAWLATNLNTWQVQEVLTYQTPTLPILGLILAATGKSAQFGLHPWLPSAMEGPTPVSALLHSSTMVVAGIFLLIRFNPLLHQNQLALLICLCIGATTTTFAALCAITQNDIKKIIAFSTSSQLGLMMLTIGMDQPELAFLHVITHAFFKAMLFLCSGSVIHNLKDEQDIRKMGGTQQTLPITSTCMTIGTLALTGTPFLAGFYTKDTIIETVNTSMINAWALTTTMIATMLTAAYSLRLVFYIQLGTPRYQALSTKQENSTDLTMPITRLAIGSISAGLIISSTLLPNNPQTLTLPLLIKCAAIISTMMGLLYAWDLANQTTQLLTPKQTTQHTATSQLFLFNLIMHRKMPKMTKSTANTSIQLIDLAWYETIGPTLVKNSNIIITKNFSASNTGLIKTYLLALLALLLSCLLVSIYLT
uniref:NADH-ubiquinone oxidoreductase chain 5 n=1 Tax=Haemodracon trachyrhinus TaxID=1216929 RepID=A0A7R7J318_9SAUR|nr:NADH dehydrogenase subunit 5 [Haemodracon trachyrhinus]